MSIGTLAAYLWSAFVVITRSGGHVYFEVAAAVTVAVTVLSPLPVRWRCQWPGRGRLSQ